jgi:hypothetical protein
MQCEEVGRSWTEENRRSGENRDASKIMWDATRKCDAKSNAKNGRLERNEAGVGKEFCERGDAKLEQ